MKMQLSLKDYENFSAYLDGQLSPAETKRLEEQLKAEPEQRAALEDMAATRNLLRSAPRYRAPRNFTLTPEMAKQNMRRSFFPALPALPAFRFSAAMATLSLIAVLVLELSGSLFTSPAALNVAMAPEAAPAAAQKAGESADSQPLAEPTLVIQWDSSGQGGFGGGSDTNLKPALGLGGGMGGGMGGSGQVEPTPINPLAGPVTLPPNAAESLPQSAAQATPSDQARSFAAGTQVENPILGLPSQTDGGKMIAPNGELKDLPEVSSAARELLPAAEPQPAASWLNPRRIAELGLVLLAVAAGLVALYFRRRAA